MAQHKKAVGVAKGRGRSGREGGGTGRRLYTRKRPRTPQRRPHHTRRRRWCIPDQHLLQAPSAVCPDCGASPPPPPPPSCNSPAVSKGETGKGDGGQHHVVLPPVAKAVEGEGGFVLLAKVEEGRGEAQMPPALSRGGGATRRRNSGAPQCCSRDVDLPTHTHRKRGGENQAAKRTRNAMGTGRGVSGGSAFVRLFLEERRREERGDGGGRTRRWQERSGEAKKK